MCPQLRAVAEGHGEGLKHTYNSLKMMELDPFAEKAIKKIGMEGIGFFKSFFEVGHLCPDGLNRLHPRPEGENIFMVCPLFGIVFKHSPPKSWQGHPSQQATGTKLFSQAAVARFEN